MAEALLQIVDLSVSYRTRRGAVEALSDLSMTVPAGAAVGIVGESGCGKTTLAKALLRLLPSNGQIDHGQVYFGGKDLALLSKREMRGVRWRDIAMVPQSAMNSLNPVYKVGAQLVETMVVRQGLRRQQARQRAAQLFQMVGIEVERLGDYPHQFSGGMKQRATIALAMALSPQLIIADEPTTALDVLVEARILELLGTLRQEYGLTLIYITHDLSVVARTCDFVGVMYAGELVEYGPTRRVLEEPFHPYTMGLIGAVPRAGASKREPVSIPGAPPGFLKQIPFCRFAERCPFAEERCRKEHPQLFACGPNHQAACHFAEGAVDMRQEARSPATWRRSEAGKVEVL